MGDIEAHSVFHQGDTSPEPGAAGYDPALSMKGITKHFPGVLALDRVDLSVGYREIHALVGENGAGKSTLMKILGGVLQCDGGEICLFGREVAPKTPRHAQALGISLIHQEFNLIPALSPAENILFSALPSGPFPFFVDWRAANRRAEELLRSLGADISPTAPVGRLRAAEQQLIEIARALSHKARILVMDEPTAALSDAEVRRLFELMKRLREDGVSIIYISHKLDEVMEIADRITVLRDGKNAGSMAAAEATRHRIVSLMVGRELRELYPKHQASKGDLVLEVSGLSSGRRLKDICLSLRSGEVLGIAGLMGAGQITLGRALFGLEPIDAGTVKIRGVEQRLGSPGRAMRAGVGLIPDKRKEEGLVLGMSVAKNLTLATLARVSKLGFVVRKREAQLAAGLCSSLSIKSRGPDQQVRFLSGGNQQKVVVGKWLALGPDILVLSEPTRGIDVGSKAEMYGIINDLAESGKAIILISSELPELMSMSDRILVMCEGRIAGELSRDEATQARIMHYATGGLGN